jgi:hypothetical protein
VAPAIPSRRVLVHVDVAFLNFFFKRLRQNNTGYYEHEFPFVSLCGKERNYLRCDDKPIVFHSRVRSKDPGSPDMFLYAGNIQYPIQYTALNISEETGRLYHPSPVLTPLALVGGHLALEMGKELYGL